MNRAPAVSLQGRRAIVTGGARGIGHAIAAALTRAGASVVVLDRMSAAEACADDIGACHLPVDLSDAEATTASMRTAIAELGGLDILVNNAGILVLKPILETSLDDWDRVFAVNVRAMLVTTQAAVPALRDAGGGRIINLASMAAKVGGGGEAAYAASKHAVVGLTRASAQEFGPDRITVNALCPGFVLTEMGADTRTPEMVAEWSSRSPLGRCAEPEDVAEAAVFLASDAGGYLTGQAINVSGGMVMD